MAQWEYVGRLCVNSARKGHFVVLRECYNKYHFSELAWVGPCADWLNLDLIICPILG